MDKIFEITAKAVTIQVKDERTGVEYSRTIPIDYYENANVLRLSGENLDGSSSSIVFPSSSAPALKSIQFRFFWKRAVLVDIFMVGTKLPNGVPRPVVKRTN